MQNQIKDQNLKEFLQLAPGQKEVSLAVAKDQKEVGQFKEELKNNGYKESENIKELTGVLLEGAKVFIEYSQDIKKDLYDLIIQYPSGQIYFFDTKNNKPIFATPTYAESAVLILITKSDLSELQSSGFNILQNVGLTFKTK